MPLPSRRSVLKLSLASGLLAVGGGALLALQKSKLVHPTPALRVLDATTYAVLDALADRLCPPLGEGAPGARALGVAHKIDSLLASVDETSQQQLKRALTALENALGGALFGERTRPFTQLSADEQEATLVHMRDSKVGIRRTLFRALTGLVWAVYWGDPRTWQRVGYSPPDTAALRAMYRDNLVDLDALRASPLARGT